MARQTTMPVRVQRTTLHKIKIIAAALQQHPSDVIDLAFAALLAQDDRIRNIVEASEDVSRDEVQQTAPE